MEIQCPQTVFELKTFIPRLNLATREPPSNLLGAVEDLGENVAISPWESWVLICLVRYRQLQLWALELAFGELIPSVPKFAASLKARRMLCGFVPSAPEWSFELYAYEATCTLMNRVTGQQVTIRLHERDAEPGMTDSQFVASVANLTAVGQMPCENRLRELHPSTPAIVIAFAHLMAAGVFSCPAQIVGCKCEENPENADDSDGQLRLSHQVIERSDAFADFCAKWERPDSRLWLAACMGDWFAVEQLAREADKRKIAALAADRARACREERIAVLRSWYELPGSDVAILHTLSALKDVGANDLLSRVREAFKRGEIAADGACTFVLKYDLAELCPEIQRVFEDAVRKEDSNTAIACGRFLIKHRHRADEVFTTIARISAGQAALIAIEDYPESLFSLLKDGLRSSSEQDFRTCAAILALLGGARSEKLCMAGMKKCSDPLAVAYCGMALCAMWDKWRVFGVQERVRRVLKYCKRTQRLVDLEGWDRTAINAAFDPLADLFRLTMERMADVVLTNRHKVPWASEHHRSNAVIEAAK